MFIASLGTRLGDAILVCFLPPHQLVSHHPVHLTSSLIEAMHAAVLALACLLLGVTSSGAQDIDPTLLQTLKQFQFTSYLNVLNQTFPPGSLALPLFFSDITAENYTIFVPNNDACTHPVHLCTASR